MKSLISKHKVIVVLLSFCLLAGAVGITYAWYQSNPDPVTNTFTAGNVTTEIEEEVSMSGSTITKEPIVKNTGKNDAYIRMRITISPEMGAVTLGDIDKKWKLKEDGFYYYQETVSPNGSTTAIFTKAKVTKGYTGDFEITCYQEAVQAEARVNGEITTDMKTIWEAYDNRTGVFGDSKE